MPKVTVVFSDSEKMDTAGNPVVEIETASVPKFPDEGESKFSAAQKAAIQFLSRGGQPDVVELLASLDKEAAELAKEFANLQLQINENNCGALPFDLEMIKFRVLGFKSMVEQSIESFK